ncbi:lysophospholipid acyltransferase family protein [Glycomyces buryatensis]|uniref:1-acyl-sn-glycerol-3-phosphate acyltransferase n=1 Tax=Glycomyces buryatensis TaxID=2570927 RepID=A0A4S8QGK4_9ACTN|nr:lysophospholipid acyltransferase family protein [Glycomyces buryatensis]THV39794.1 1-acyl-sn-glycerol-3-phosphate acyltransferase [Glycomyces buryatensis]
MNEQTGEAHYAFRRKGGDRLPWFTHLAGNLVKGGLLPLTKREWSGMENVPLDGPVIMVWNHYSDFDPLPVAHFAYNTGRHPRFLLKHSLVKIPVLGPMIRATEQIPVYRGSADAAESLREAIAILKRGGSVVLSPEGTVTKEPDRWPMRGKTGVARLVMETGAPVVPIVQWGSLEIHDRKRDPKFRLGMRKKVTVAALPAVDLSEWDGAEITRENLTAITDRIMEALSGGLAEMRGEAAPPLFDPRQNRKQQSEESEPNE